MIEPLEAGQELDTLIAEHVMGYRVTRFRPANYPVDVTVFWLGDEPMYTCDEKSCNFMMFRNGVDDKAGIVPTLPGYSTEIEDAWEVVEKLRLWVIPTEKGWLAGTTDDRFMYLDSEIGIIDGHLDNNATADTAPLAICRAALAAVSGGGAPSP